MSVSTVNPASGETIRTFPVIPLQELLAILTRQQEESAAWRNLSIAGRGDCFRRAATNLRANRTAYAGTITLEMGKPIKESIAEVEKCATVCEYYAEHAADFLKAEDYAEVSGGARVEYTPLGSVLAIMPWNFPFWQVFRAAAPAMMAGNVMALKHSSCVPQCALTIEAIFQNSGFPTHAFRSLLTDSAGAAVAIASPFIQAVTFTGSTAAGQLVAAQAASQIKKCVLELGGNDPYLVLPDADIDRAVRACVTGRLRNAGQSCIAVKRIILCEEIAAAFRDKLLAALANVSTGDPMDDTTELGPMCRQSYRDALHKQVTESVAAGAELVTGGTIPDRPGAWYPLTVLDHVGKGTPAYDDELFGPVFSLIRARDVDHAVEIANDSVYGLGAGIFSRDEVAARLIARDRLACGTCTINDFTRSDPRLPFGGIRMSGYGRELGMAGIHEFVNIKTIVTAR